MLVIVKSLGDTMPPGQIVFFRSFFGLIPLVLLGFRGTGFAKLRWVDPRNHLARSLAGVAGMFAWFYALSLLPLAPATAISFAGPIFLTLIAVFVLHERVDLLRWVATFLGLAGVLVIVGDALFAKTPGAGLNPVGIAFALGSAVFSALAMATVRRITATETSESIAFWFLVAGSVAGLMTLPWGWTMPTPSEFGLLLVMGCCGGIAQTLLTMGYRYAEASVLAPIDYLALLWASLFGVLLFGDILTPNLMVGAAIIVASGLVLAFAERRRRSKLLAPPPELP